MDIWQLLPKNIVLITMNYNLWTYDFMKLVFITRAPAWADFKAVEEGRV